MWLQSVSFLIIYFLNVATYGQNSSPPSIQLRLCKMCCQRDYNGAGHWKNRKKCKRYRHCTESSEISKKFNIPSFGIPNVFFDQNSQKRTSLFDNHCDTILDVFSKKWKSNCQRQEYLMNFTLTKWKRLSAAEKNSHSLQKCTACAVQHFGLQEAFPGPTFETDLSSIYICSTNTYKTKERSVTRKTLKLVNFS